MSSLTSCFPACHAFCIADYPDEFRTRTPGVILVIAVTAGATAVMVVVVVVVLPIM